MTKGKSPSPHLDLSLPIETGAKDARRVTQDKMLGVIEPQLLMEHQPSTQQTKKGGILDHLLPSDDIPIDDIFDSLFTSEKTTPPEEHSLNRKNTSMESAVQLAALEAAEVYGTQTTELQAAPSHAALPHHTTTNADADVVAASPPSSDVMRHLQHAPTDGELSIAKITQFSTPAAPADLSTVQFAIPMQRPQLVEPSSLMPKTSAVRPQPSGASPFSLDEKPKKPDHVGATLHDEPLNPHATRIGLSLGHLINPLELGVDLVQLTEEETQAPPLEMMAPNATSEDWSASTEHADIEEGEQYSFDDISRESQDDIGIDPVDEAHDSSEEDDIGRESFDELAPDGWAPFPPEEVSKDWGGELNPLQTSIFRAAVDDRVPAPVSFESLLPDTGNAGHASSSFSGYQGGSDVDAFFAASQSPSEERAPTYVNQPNLSTEEVQHYQQTAPANDTFGDTESFPLHPTTKGKPRMAPAPVMESSSTKVSRGDRFGGEGQPQRFSETLPLGRSNLPPVEVMQVLEGTPVESGPATRPMTRPSPNTPAPSTASAMLNASSKGVGATIQDLPRGSVGGEMSVGATIQDQPRHSLRSKARPDEEVQSGVLWSAVSQEGKHASPTHDSGDSFDPDETALEAEVSTAYKAMSLDLLEPKQTVVSPPNTASTDIRFQDTASLADERSPTMGAQGPIPSGVSLQNTTRNTTVLPKVRMIGSAHELINEARERYEVVRKLGEGAVGEVSLAKDNDIHRLVAIKRLKEADPHPGSLVRFVEEIQTNGQLEHPNIAPVHDVGVDADGRYFFVMKYVRGDNLEEIIAKLRSGDPEAHRVYTPHYRTQVALEILRAIQFAHEQGVVHRDLKPSNIIVGPHGEVMVMDWGIAKAIRKDQPSRTLNIPAQVDGLFVGDVLQKEERVFETSVGTLIGTPAYMAPEQALGFNDRVDQRSDIYSLCALLYEFFSLRHYMAHKTDMKSLLLGIISEAPPALDKVKSPHQTSPSRILGSLLAKGLEKEPSQRYTSVQELSDALQSQFLEGHNAIACSYSLMRRSSNEFLGFLDRHPKLGPLLGMLMMVFALFGGVAAMYLIAAKFF